MRLWAISLYIVHHEASLIRVCRLLIVPSAYPPARGSTLGRSLWGIVAMNADEAQKCLLVAQRLLVQAFIGDAFVELEDEAALEELLNAALEALEGATL